jgi:hypothetical protein
VQTAFVTDAPVGKGFALTVILTVRFSTEIRQLGATFCADAT